MKNPNPIYIYTLHFRNGETKKILCTFDHVHTQQHIYVDAEDKTKIFNTRYPLAGEDDIKKLLSFFFFDKEATKVETEVKNIKGAKQ